MRKQVLACGGQCCLGFHRERVVSSGVKSAHTTLVKPLSPKHSSCHEYFFCLKYHRTVWRKELKVGLVDLAPGVDIAQKQSDDTSKTRHQRSSLFVNRKIGPRHHLQATTQEKTVTNGRGTAAGGACASLAVGFPPKRGKVRGPKSKFDTLEAATVGQTTRADRLVLVMLHQILGKIWQKFRQRIP